MRKLYRNISVVTTVFMLVLAVMLGVSYYQMQQVSPLETGVMDSQGLFREGRSTEGRALSAAGHGGGAGCVPEPLFQGD